MLGNKNAWRAPLAGLAPLAMTATIGVAAGTANAATKDDPNKPNVTLAANGFGSFAGDNTTSTIFDVTTGEKGTTISVPFRRYQNEFPRLVTNYFRLLEILRRGFPRSPKPEL